MYSPHPLTPAVFHILLALADGEKHGYAIMQEVSESTGGAVVLGPGTLYGSIKRMLADGLLEEAGERHDPESRDPESGNDERRRYYRITAHGRKTAVSEAERLQGLVRVAQAKRLLRRSKEA